MLFTICFFEFSPSVIASSAHPFSLSQFHSGTVSLCYSVGLWRLQDPVSAVMQHWCVMQHERTLIALTFCQHFYSLFKGLHGESAGACIRLHLEGSLRAAFSPREKEGVKLLFPLKQWKLRGDMQRCAHEWQGSGMCVGQWPGVSVPKPLSQRLTMNLHRVGTPRGHRPAPFVLHFKTHKHL